MSSESSHPQALEIERHEGACSQKTAGPSQRKEAVKALQSLGRSERQTCLLARRPLSASTAQYNLSRTRRRHAIREASAAARCGTPTLRLAPVTYTPTPAQLHPNHKRLRRIYREKPCKYGHARSAVCGLIRGNCPSHRSKPQRRVGLRFHGRSPATAQSTRPHHRDRFSREGLRSTSISRSRSSASSAHSTTLPLSAAIPSPAHRQRPENISVVLQSRRTSGRLALHHPGKPSKRLIESFTRAFATNFSTHAFSSPKSTSRRLWLIDYNRRPHSSRLSHTRNSSKPCTSPQYP